MKIQVVGLTIVALMLGAAAAHAQGTPKAEMSLGYAYMHDNDLSDNFPKGFVASIGGYFSDWFALVGEVGGNYKSVSSGGGSATLSVTTFLAGPKFSASSRAPVSPFVQILFGAARGKLNISGGGASIDLPAETNFATQLGGGLDLNLSPNFGVRGQLDLRSIRSNGSTSNESRLAAGLVFRW